MYLTCCLNILLISAPHPSKKCQQQFGQLCVKDNQLASEFLNGLLNQLNWSFSEFIGMLQEVGQFQNTSDLGCTRHQLEICRVKPQLVILFCFFLWGGWGEGRRKNC